jgi:uncharacterized caspase-like protein
MNRFVICILAAILAAPVPVEAQRIFLLSVGVADYPGRDIDLVLPAKDARAIYKLYQTNTKTTSVLLTDKDARKARILSEAKKLFGKARPDDIVVFYFAGHGSDEGFVAVDEMLYYGEVRRMFADCKARNKIIYADSCLSGIIRDNPGGNGLNDSKNNIMLFLSSRSHEFSGENPHMKNGIFTTCLLRSLKGGADVNRDRIITAKELFTAVSKGVKVMSHNQQHPVMWGNFNDTMPVMVWK